MTLYNERSGNRDAGRQSEEPVHGCRVGECQSWDSNPDPPDFKGRDFHADFTLLPRRSRDHGDRDGTVLAPKGLRVQEQRHVSEQLGERSRNDGRVSGCLGGLAERRHPA